MSYRQQVAATLEAASQTLGLARQSQKDFIDNADRRLIGFYSCLTCARSTISVLDAAQGLAADFDRWYPAARAALHDDPVIGWLYDVHAGLESPPPTGPHHIDLHVATLSARQLAAMQPPGTLRTFLSDAIGRGGHLVRLADGSVIPVYFRLSAAAGKSDSTVDRAPDGRPVEEWLEQHLTALESMVHTARQRFNA